MTPLQVCLVADNVTGARWQQLEVELAAPTLSEISSTWSVGAEAVMDVGRI